MWNPTKDSQELESNVTTDTNLDSTLKKSVHIIIKESREVFCKDRTKRPILGYAFCIDTSASPPICYYRPTYRIYESFIVIEHKGSTYNKLKELPEGGHDIFE